MPVTQDSQSSSLFQEAGLGIQGPQAAQARRTGAWQAGTQPTAHSRTSLGTKGLKKQSSSLRRLMVRLPLVEAITSLTEDRTKAMVSCRG